MMHTQGSFVYQQQKKITAKLWLFCHAVKLNIVRFKCFDQKVTVALGIFLFVLFFLVFFNNVPFLRNPPIVLGKMQQMQASL